MTIKYKIEDIILRLQKRSKKTASNIIITRKSFKD